MGRTFPNEITRLIIEGAAEVVAAKNAVVLLMRKITGTATKL